MKFKISLLICFLVTFSITSFSQTNKLLGEWTLTSLKEDGNNIELPVRKSEDEDRYINFLTKSKVNLLASCNHINGKYAAEKGGKFNVKLLVTTAKACFNEEGRFEISLKKTIAKVTKYRIKTKVLTLQDETGMNSLTLIRSPKVSQK